MKLSDLSTDRAADVLCEITPYIANLAGDKKLLDTLKEKLGSEKMSVAEVYTYGAQKLAVIVPIALKDHRADVFGLLAVLNETSPDEIAKQNILTTMQQISDLVQDKELRDFFSSLLPQTENA